jgi:hypothetical protein
MEREEFGLRKYTIVDSYFGLNEVISNKKILKTNTK